MIRVPRGPSPAGTQRCVRPWIAFSRWGIRRPVGRGTTILSTTDATSATTTRARLSRLRSADEPATALTGGETLDVSGDPSALLATSVLPDELPFRVSRVAP
jgi:hypothetical protein